MKLIKSCSIGRLHELIVEHISANGYQIKTEDGEVALQGEPVCLYTDTPFDDYRISKCSSFQKEFMEKYTHDLLYGNENDFVYTYHKRLFEYNGVNQIDYIVKKLSDENRSRRAVAITWMPDKDEGVKDVPCLQYIQCCINPKTNKLDMYVAFRSNDMLSAFGANAYALTCLQREIAFKLNLEVGSYTHVSWIPHIYAIRDAADLKRFLNDR